MKPICFIPARGSSKGVRRKNIRLLGKKPLIAYTIESAISSKLFQHVMVSTENKAIATTAKNYGAEIPFMRPNELAKDNTTTDKVLLHGIKKLQKIGIESDIIVLRDCTVPFIDKTDLSKALDLLNKEDCDGVFGAIKAHPNPYFGMMELNAEGYLIPSKHAKRKITRRQDAPVVYDVDGMFLLKTQNFLKTRKIYSGKILPYEISKQHGHMIDFEFDFKVAELLIKENLNM